MRLLGEGQSQINCGKNEEEKEKEEKANRKAWKLTILSPFPHNPSQRFTVAPAVTRSKALQSNLRLFKPPPTPPNSGPSDWNYKSRWWWEREENPIPRRVPCFSCTRAPTMLVSTQMVATMRRLQRVKRQGRPLLPFLRRRLFCRSSEMPDANWQLIVSKKLHKNKIKPRAVTSVFYIFFNIYFLPYCIHCKQRTLSSVKRRKRFSIACDQLCNSAPSPLPHSATPPGPCHRPSNWLCIRWIDLFN